ncbi:MAG: helix-turn-helix domain-containing protein [Trebonia sp.]
MSIGDTLARARRDAGLSITQVSQRTRIREAIVRGIEDDDFSPCGGDFYARGHIRSMAKAVGLDPGPLIQEYDDAHGGLRQASAAEVFEPATPIKIRERRPPNWSAAMALAVIAVIIYWVVHSVAGASHHVNTAARGEPVRHPSVTATAKPGHSHVPAVASQYRHSVVVQLSTTAASWVSVSTIDGTLVYEGILPAGTTRTWTANQQLSLNIGNAGGVELTVNGKKLGAPGGPGEVTNVSFGPTQRG